MASSSVVPSFGLVPSPLVLAPGLDGATGEPVMAGQDSGFPAGISVASKSTLLSTPSLWSDPGTGIDAPDSPAVPGVVFSGPMPRPLVDGSVVRDPPAPTGSDDALSGLLAVPGASGATDAASEPEEVPVPENGSG